MGLPAQKVSDLLTEFSLRLSLAGENPYRTRAYARAAESLRALAEPLDRIIAEGRLRQLPGIGEGIAAVVEELHRKGSHPTLDRLRQDVPAGVLEMLSLPGLKPERVLKLHKTLGIASLEDLDEAARADKLAKARGLGAAFQGKILQALDIRRKGQGKHHIHRAAQLLAAASQSLQTARPELKSIVPAGDYRRSCELVEDLVLVAESPKPKEIPHRHSRVLGVEVCISGRNTLGAATLFATGSADHIEALKIVAEHRGLTLDEHGVRKGSKIIASRIEEDIYAALGLPFIEPELREGRDEVVLAVKNRLPILVSDEDVRGILHAHTDRSDGADTLEAMAETTRACGYAYFGVSDHSRSAGYAGGLSLAEIDAQHAEIDVLNKRLGKSFRIFKGIESDILPDGSLDYSDEVLARFDFVIASVHGRFGLDRKTQTSRILRAVANPRSTILGHMTGRQLLRRAGYDIDVEQVLKACAKHGVVVEVNGSPWRLDLDWRWCVRALELGCMLSLNPDAHSTSEIDYVHWAVRMARKGGVPKERVLNCMTAAAVGKHFAARRKARRQS